MIIKLRIPSKDLPPSFSSQRVLAHKVLFFQNLTCLLCIVCCLGFRALCSCFTFAFCRCSSQWSFCCKRGSHTRCNVRVCAVSVDVLCYHLVVLSDAFVAVEQRASPRPAAFVCSNSCSRSPKPKPSSKKDRSAYHFRFLLLTQFLVCLCCFRSVLIRSQCWRSASPRPTRRAAP